MAIKANLIIDQGASYSTSLTLVNDQGETANLVGYSANSQLRKTFTSSNSHTFTASVDTSLSIITLALNANQTANIAAGRYVYDVFLTDSSGVVSRIVEGIVTVTPRVTR